MTRFPFWCPHCNSFDRRNWSSGGCRYFRGFVIVIFVVAVFAALAVMLGTGVGAQAHEAPTGWSYSTACCSGVDCGQLHTNVKATSVGWLIIETGETVPYSDRRIKGSGDEFFHRCVKTVDGKDTGETRCLYVPGMGF